MTNTEFLTVDQAAELMNVKKQTIYQYVWKKQIPAYKPFGNRLFFRKDELLEIMGQGRKPTADEIESEAATYVLNRGRK